MSSESSKRLVDYNGGLIISCVYKEQPDSHAAVVVAIDIVEDYKTGEIVPTFDIHGAMRDQQIWPDFVMGLRRMVGGSEFMLMDILLVADTTDGGRVTAEAVHALETNRFKTMTAVMAYETQHEGYFEGLYHIPVRDVVEALITSYQLGRIEIAKDLELAEQLAASVEELSLRNMKTIDPMALACALGVFQGIKGCPNTLEPAMGEVGYDTMNWRYDA